MRAPGGEGENKGRPQGRARSPVYAAIDLGTNNCRLLVAEPLSNGGFRVLDSFSRIVRLGEGVAASGALSEDAIARTVEALAVCARRLKRHGRIPLRAVATAACRLARNAEALVVRVEAEAGIRLEIVSEEEEARLAAIGCAPLVGRGYAGALVFDIGGGSTEIIWLKRASHAIETAFIASVPIGVVVLSETDGHYAEFLREAMTAYAEVAKRMTVEAGPFCPKTHHLLGTSGTVTTLAGVSLDLPRYDRKRVDGSWHSRAHLMDVARRLVALGPAERAKLRCIGAARADLMPAGCAAFAAIQELWPCEKLRVADRGLREGILRELMGQA